MQRAFVCFLMISIANLSACREADSSEEAVDADTHPAINRSVDDLNKLIALPSMPEAVKWTTTQAATVECKRYPLLAVSADDCRYEE